MPNSSLSDRPKLGNHLLDDLSPAALAALRPHFETFALRLNEVIHEPGGRLPYVIFPTSGMISVLATMASGATVEVGLVGREGMFNIATVLGDEMPSQKAVVQLAGSGVRIKTALFASADRTVPELHALLLRYAQVQLVNAAQSAACNRLHQLQPRCARWILSARDRSDSDTFTMTHEFLSMMLGVRRPGVTIAVKTFREAGLIAYRHGTMTINDRQGLEAVSCECYRFVKDESERILGAP